MAPADDEVGAGQDSVPDLAQEQVAGGETASFAFDPCQEVGLEAVFLHGGVLVADPAERVAGGDVIAEECGKVPQHGRTRPRPRTPVPPDRRSSSLARKRIAASWCRPPRSSACAAAQ